MAEATATPATSAPQASSPQASGGSDAKNPGQVGEVKTQVDPFEEALSKSGGLKVKAGGKEHVVKDKAHLERILQRGIPVEESLRELASEKQKMQPLMQALQSLSQGDEDAALGILEQLLGGEKLDKVSEKRLMRFVEKQKRLEGLSERERAMAEEVDRLKSEKAKFEAEKKRQEQEAMTQREAQQAHQLKQHIATEVGGALEMAGLPQELTIHALKLMQPLVESSIRAGQPLDRATLAAEAKEGLASMLKGLAGSLKGEQLLSFFGDDIGKQYKAALREQIRQKRGVPATSSAQAKPEAGEAGWDPRQTKW